MKEKQKPDVLKTKKRPVYKSNKLNKANFAEFNLNDYRVYLNAITLIGGVDQQGKYLQPEELKREYILSAKEFSEQFNVDLKSSYRVLKSAVDKLMKSSIRLEQPDLFKITVINVCEKAEYNLKDGSITVLFTGSIMEYLKQRQNNFTLYNLKEVADLTSIYSVRLYELMQQWNTTTGMLIHTIEQWREILGILPDQYSTYNNLKQKVFMQALNEINAKTTYELVMTEEKTGRKVVRVRFDFNKDKILKGLDVRTGEITTRHIKNTKRIPKSEKAQLTLELESNSIDKETAVANLNAKLNDPANKNKFIKHEKGVPLISKETAKRGLHNFKAQTAGVNLIIDSLAQAKAQALELIELLDDKSKSLYKTRLESKQTVEEIDTLSHALALILSKMAVK